MFKAFDVLMVLCTVAGVVLPFFLHDFMWSHLFLAPPAGAYVGSVISRFRLKEYN